MLSQFHFILVGFHQPYTLTISTTSSAAASSSSSFLPFRNQSKQSHTIVCVLIPCSASHTRYFRKQTINFKLLQHTQICAHIFHGFRPPLLHADTCTHTYGTETQNLFIINARIKGEQTQNILFFFCYTQNGRTNAGRREVQQQHEKKKHSSNLSPSYFLPHSVKRWCNPTATERVRSRPWQQHKAYSHNTQSLLRVLLSTAASKYLKISLHKK